MVTSKAGSRNEMGDLAIAVFRVNAHLVEAGNEMVKDIGITSAWWQVLGAMDHADSLLPVSEIARIMGLKRQSVQRIVDVMADRGFVRLEENPRHRRAKLVAFTDKGASAVNLAYERQAPWAQALVKLMGDARVSAAVALLTELDQILTDALGATNPERPGRSGDKG